MDRKLSDEEFVGHLKRARIPKAVAISRNLEGFRDAKGEAFSMPLVPLSSYILLLCW